MRVNPALCEIFGRDEEGLVGIAPLEFVHVDEARRIGRSFSDLASEDVTVMAEEILFVTPDGNPVWVKALSSTVRDDDGEALYYIAYVQDITAQRAIREQERAATERFETAFDAAPIGMALVGLKIVVAMISRKTTKRTLPEADKDEEDREPAPDAGDAGLPRRIG